MDDYVVREAVRDVLYEADAITMKGVAILNQFPAADVAPVVRCKDCKHRSDSTDGGNYLCNRKMLGLVRPNDFVASEIGRTVTASDAGKSGKNS